MQIGKINYFIMASSENKNTNKNLHFGNQKQRIKYMYFLIEWRMRVSVIVLFLKQVGFTLTKQLPYDT